MNFVNSSYELTLLKKKSLHISDSIIQIWPDCTEAKFLDEISRFLKYAPGRIGGGGRGRDVILVVFKKNLMNQSVCMLIYFLE